MFETIGEHLAVLGQILVTLGIAWFAWLASGVGNVAIKSSLKDWSWSRMAKDLLKIVCFAVSMLACSIATDVLSYFVDKLGISELTTFADTVSWGVIVVIPLIATYYLIYRALKNNRSIVNFDEASKEIGVEGNIKVKTKKES